MKMKKGGFSKALLIIIATVVLLCSTPVFLYVLPYNNFRAAEKAAIPKFDALNENTLSEIEPPRNNVVVHRNSVGIDPSAFIHGRELSVSYSMNNLTNDEILSYYSTHLIKSGWIQINQTDVGVFYYRRDACFSLKIFQHDQLFEINIWHDYFSQSFSPPVPDWFGWSDGGKTVSFFELLEMDSNILRCPDS